MVYKILHIPTAKYVMRRRIEYEPITRGYLCNFFETKSEAELYLARHKKMLEATKWIFLLKPGLTEDVKINPNHFEIVEVME